MQIKTPLPDTWAVPAIFRERLGDSAGRQRAMFADGHLLLVLHEPPGDKGYVRRGRFFWRKPDGRWESTYGSGSPRALEKHVGEFERLVRRFEEEEEAAVGASAYHELLDALAPVRRCVRHLHDALQHARELVPQDKGIIALRDDAGDLDRATELLAVEGRNGLDYALAQNAEEQALAANRMASASHRLNWLAAIFFPIVTVATVFGMNLRSGIEERNAPWLFWLILLACIVSGVMFAVAVMGGRGTPLGNGPRPDKPSETRRIEP